MWTTERKGRLSNDFEIICGVLMQKIVGGSGRRIKSPEKNRDLFPPGGGTPSFGDPRTLTMLEQLEDEVSSLKPITSRQQWLKAQALQVVGEIETTRWALAQPNSSLIPLPLATDASRSLSNHCHIFIRLMQLVTLTFSTRVSSAIGTIGEFRELPEGKTLEIGATRRIRTDDLLITNGEARTSIFQLPRKP